MSLTFADRFLRQTNAVASAELEAVARDYLPQMNVVANGDLGALDINIRASTQKRPYSYVPEQFEAVVLRYIDNEPTTLLCFRNGKVVIVGSKCIEMTFAALHRFREDLAEQHDVVCSMCNFFIDNMVYVTHIKGAVGIKIAEICRDNLDVAKYTPRVFPGVRIVQGPVVLRGFDSNQWVLMAVIESRQVHAIINCLAQIATKYVSNYVALPQDRFRYRNDQHDKVFEDMPMTTHVGSS